MARGDTQAYSPSSHRLEEADVEVLGVSVCWCEASTISIVRRLPPSQGSPGDGPEGESMQKKGIEMKVEGEDDA